MLRYACSPCAEHHKKRVLEIFPLPSGPGQPAEQKTQSTQRKQLCRISAPGSACLDLSRKVPTGVTNEVIDYIVFIPFLVCIRFRWSLVRIQSRRTTDFIEKPSSCFGELGRSFPFQHDQCGHFVGILIANLVLLQPGFTALLVNSVS